MKIQQNNFSLYLTLALAVFLFIVLVGQLFLLINSPDKEELDSKKIQLSEINAIQSLNLTRQQVNQKSVVFPEIELLGTILGNFSVAFIFEPSTGKSCLYRLGDTIDGALIINISKGKIVLEKQGHQKEFYLSSARQLADSTPKVYQQKGADLFIINKYEMIAQLVREKELLSKLKVLPVAEQGSSKLRGFLLENVPAGSIIEQVGIQNGDIIYSVQGQPLTSIQEALNIFNRLPSQSQIEIVLVRGNDPITLRYEIRN
ncbi:MAG: hypothetical protein N2606_00305 [Candidatus Omnitrophica bacterium]|nr:hypothetical protein [Candidatus Omnitrophota bacterium]